MRLAITEEAIDRDLTGEDLLKAIKEANPLSKSKAPEVEAMAKWAENNALNASRLEKSKASAKTGAEGAE